jgi:hypothetical protein
MYVSVFACPILLDYETDHCVEGQPCEFRAPDLSLQPNGLAKLLVSVHERGDELERDGHPPGVYHDSNAQFKFCIGL